MEIHGQNVQAEYKGGDRVQLGPTQIDMQEDGAKVMKAIEREIQAVRSNPNLSEGEKRRLVAELEEQKREFKNEAVAARYNEMVDSLQRSKRARLEANSKAKGASNAGKGSSGKVSSPKSESGASKASGRADSGGSTETSDAAEEFEPEAFANRMMEDPEAAMDMLDGMNYKEKNMALQEAQLYMQQIQRMMKMQSNMTSLAHKTQSSIIQNIR